MAFINSGLVCIACYLISFGFNSSFLRRRRLKTSSLEGAFNTSLLAAGCFIKIKIELLLEKKTAAVFPER